MGRLGALVGIVTYDLLLRMADDLAGFTRLAHWQRHREEKART